MFFLTLGELIIVVLLGFLPMLTQKRRGTNIGAKEQGPVGSRGRRIEVCGQKLFGGRCSSRIAVVVEYNEVTGIVVAVAAAFALLPLPVCPPPVCCV